MRCVSVSRGSRVLSICRIFFFFQAEDGIRDGHVTGVQTCALPICAVRQLVGSSRPVSWINTAFPFGAAYLMAGGSVDLAFVEIGRASCRETGWMAVGTVLIVEAKKVHHDESYVGVELADRHQMARD